MIQSHIERNRRLPSTDYIPDTNSVLDQAIRVLQAMIDISADQGQLQATLGVITVMQCIKQAMWAADSELLILPNISTSNTEYFSSNGVNQLTDFKKMKSTYIKTLFQNTPGLSARQADDMFTTLSNLPDLKVKFEIVTAGSVASATAVSEILKASKTNEWRLKASQEYDLNLEIFRYGAARIVGNEIKASAPYFPKPQSESWIAVLGEESTDELYVVKRTSLIPSKSSSNVTASSRLSLRFMAPENPGKTRLSLQIMSDVYRGVDYVVEISVDVVECFL